MSLLPPECANPQQFTRTRLGVAFPLLVRSVCEGLLVGRCVLHLRACVSASSSVFTGRVSHSIEVRSRGGGGKLQMRGRLRPPGKLPLGPRRYVLPHRLRNHATNVRFEVSSSAPCARFSQIGGRGLFFSLTSTLRLALSTNLQVSACFLFFSELGSSSVLLAFCRLETEISSEVSVSFVRCSWRCRGKELELEPEVAFPSRPRDVLWAQGGTSNLAPHITITFFN